MNDKPYQREPDFGHRYGPRWATTGQCDAVYATPIATLHCTLQLDHEGMHTVSLGLAGALLGAASEGADMTADFLAGMEEAARMCDGGKSGYVCAATIRDAISKLKSQTDEQVKARFDYLRRVEALARAAERLRISYE